MQNDRRGDVADAILTPRSALIRGRQRAYSVAILLVSLLLTPLDAEPQSGRKYLVGVLTPHQHQWREDAFRQRLRELGYVEGGNLILDVRSAEAELDRLTVLSRDLVARRPDVIVAVNAPGTRAARGETKTVPIVMAMVGDPIGLGFVTNLARPGGNMTGLSNIAGELAAKRFGLLREAVPAARRIALLYHPDEPIVGPQVRSLEAVGRQAGVEFRLLAVRTQADLERAFDAAVEWRAEAVMRLAGQAITFGRQTAEQAIRRRLPSMLFTARDVEDGALMSYYVDDDAAFRRVADYVDRILRGAMPGELPIEQPTRYEFVVNLRTARALGLTLSPSLLLRADRVIE